MFINLPVTKALPAETLLRRLKEAGTHTHTRQSMTFCACQLIRTKAEPLIPLNLGWENALGPSVGKRKAKGENRVLIFLGFLRFPSAESGVVCVESKRRSTF